MKTPDKYRFTLQWGTDTVEKVQAGELLESLGNRKSEFVVLAVAEYIRNHPEALTSGQKFKIVVQSSFTRDEMESIVRRMIEEKMANTSPIRREGGGVVEEPAISDADVNQMLKNLDIFSKP